MRVYAAHYLFACRSSNSQPLSNFFGAFEAIKRCLMVLLLVIGFGVVVLLLAANKRVTDGVDVNSTSPMLRPLVGRSRVRTVYGRIVD